MIPLERKSQINLDNLRVIEPPKMAMNEVVQGIYCCIDNRNSEVVYVGLSENVRTRIYQHIQQLNRQSKTKRYWDDAFKADSAILQWILLEEVVDRSNLNERELY